MNKNDKKIIDLIKKIETNKKNLGEQPKPTYKTNGKVVYNVSYKTNIHTLDRENCVVITANLISYKESLEKANSFFEDLSVKDKIKELHDSIDDVRERYKVVFWLESYKKIQDLEEKLKSLRSEEFKTEEILKEIEKEI